MKRSLHWNFSVRSKFRKTLFPSKLGPFHPLPTVTKYLTLVSNHFDERNNMSKMIYCYKYTEQHAYSPLMYRFDHQSESNWPDRMTMFVNIKTEAPCIKNNKMQDYLILHNELMKCILLLFFFLFQLNIYTGVSNWRMEIGNIGNCYVNID